MKKEVTFNLISNGHPIKVTTTLVITQQEIDNLFAQKEKDFLKAFGTTSNPAPPNPFNHVDDFAYENYEDEESEESEEEALSYTPYAHRAQPAQPKKDEKYTPYASLNAQFPKSYHEQLENGYSPYNTWRVNVPTSKKIVIQDK